MSRASAVNRERKVIFALWDGAIVGEILWGCFSRQGVKPMIFISMPIDKILERKLFWKSVHHCFLRFDSQFGLARKRTSKSHWSIFPQNFLFSWFINIPHFFQTRVAFELVKKLFFSGTREVSFVEIWPRKFLRWTACTSTSSQTSRFDYEFRDLTGETAPIAKARKVFPPIKRRLTYK